MRSIIRSSSISWVLAAASLAYGCGLAASAARPSRASGVAPQPRLVLQITVDQLRGDLPTRYRDRLGDGGFRAFLEGGTVYADAHHAHANTETIVGHATLATGAHPADHGMVGNVWFDRASGVTVYNIEDPRHRLLTDGADVDRETEIDPTKRAASTEGRSPGAMLVSTFSDELVIATGGRAKAFGVSVKDRGAVSLAGHAGKAFWFSKATGSFVTSDYYYDAYPDWVRAWNAKRLPDAYADASWNLLLPARDYLFGDADDRPWERDLAGFGRTFPHPYGAADGRYYTTLLTVSPAGDELTLDFAKALIDGEGLGRDATPDYLSISFSSTDYVGHLFGPSSLESEDTILRLDRILADLLRFVDARVGLAHTLVVLSADHGGPEAPGFMSELGIEADYAALPDGAGDDLIATYVHPYVYLDRTAVRARGLGLEEAARRVAAELEAHPDVAHAVSTHALRAGRLVPTDLHRAVAHNDHRARSGDVYVVFEAHRFVNDFDGLEVAAAHGSPWSYDSYVPIFFLGPDVPARNVYRRVHTVGVAPTLAAYLRIKPPSGSRAEPLVEVLRNR